MASHLGGGLGDRGQLHYKELGGDEQLGEGRGEASQPDAGDPGGGFGRHGDPTDCVGEKSRQASPRSFFSKAFLDMIISSVVGGWCPWKYVGEAVFEESPTEKSVLKEISWQGR